MNNFFNISRKLENFRKGVINVDTLDEPTWLTFSIDFDFQSQKDYRDKIATSPLFNEVASGQSAQIYLANRGLQRESDQLARFKGILRYLTDEAPWYFQGLTGLDKMWADATKMENNFKGAEKVLTIDTLEAVDLRITELADLYRSSIYDKTFMRENVPDNLRWFKMDIYVAEMRNLRNVLPQIAGIDLGTGAGLLGSGNQFGNILDNFGFYKFECFQCEFDFSKSFAPGSEAISTASMDAPNTNKFDIKIGWYREGNSYASGIDTSESYRNRFDLTGLGSLPVIGDTITSYGGKVQDALKKITNAPATVINQLVGEAQALVEGGSFGQASPFGYEQNGDIIPPGKTPPDNLGTAG